MKNLLKAVATSRSLEDICGYTYNEVNQEIKKRIEKELLHRSPTLRDIEYMNIIADEKARYEVDRIDFELNPIHWTNNKRRKYGLCTLRGKINKNREVIFYPFKPTPRLFFAIEDMIDTIIPERIVEQYGQFADIKTFVTGDKPWKNCRLTM